MDARSDALGLILGMPLVIVLLILCILCSRYCSGGASVIMDAEHHLWPSHKWAVGGPSEERPNRRAYKHAATTDEADAVFQDGEDGVEIF